jgi:hypothetical protein
VLRFRGRNLTTALDWLALVLVVAALAISLTGGFLFRFGNVRIRARDPVRAAIAVLAVIAIRAALDRQTRPLATAPALFRWIRDRVWRRGWVWLRRAYRSAADSAVPLPRASAWRRRGIAAVGSCAFATVLLLPQLRHMDSVPDLGDPLFSIWRIGWVHHKLLGDPRPLFSPNIFHPHPFTLTYSDSMLLPALTTVPLLALGLHPVIAYNLVFVCSFVASAFAMYLLVEHLTGSPGAAFVSGLLFGFYPYRFEHYSHFELQMTYCMPLALLALHRFLTTARVRDAVAAGFLFAAQLYCSMYYAVFFTFYVGALLLIVGLLNRPPVRKLLGPAAIAGALALLLAWPLARTYSAAHLGDRETRLTTSERISAVPCGRIAGCLAAARNAPCSPASWRWCWRRLRWCRPSARPAPRMRARCSSPSRSPVDSTAPCIRISTSGCRLSGGCACRRAPASSWVSRSRCWRDSACAACSRGARAG